MTSFVDQVRQLLNRKQDNERWTLVLQTVLREFQSETATIHRLEPQANLLRLVAQIGVPAEVLPAISTIPVGKGIAGETAARNAPVTVCNLQTDASGITQPQAKQTGVIGALCVPIRQAGLLLGTLGVGSRTKPEYGAADLTKLEAVASVLGDLGLD